MFDKSILETDNFLNISMGAKALYFLLGMEADDEGFVSPNRVIRLYGGEAGDLKNLVDTGLIIPFKSGVIVITDWKQNNWLDPRRTKKTQYQEEKNLLLENKNTRKYELKNDGSANAKQTLSNGGVRVEECRVEEIRVDATSSVAVPVIVKDITKVIDSFKVVNLNFKKWFSNKTERQAAGDLVMLYGLPKVLEVIEILPEVNKTAWMPTITSPYKLLNKWADLMSAIAKKKNEGEQRSAKKGRGMVI